MYISENTCFSSSHFGWTCSGRKTRALEAGDLNWNSEYSTHLLCELETCSQDTISQNEQMIPDLLWHIGTYAPPHVYYCIYRLLVAVFSFIVHKARF